MNSNTPLSVSGWLYWKRAQFFSEGLHMADPYTGKEISETDLERMPKGTCKYSVTLLDSEGKDLTGRNTDDDVAGVRFTVIRAYLVDIPQSLTYFVSRRYKGRRQRRLEETTIGIYSLVPGASRDWAADHMGRCIDALTCDHTLTTDGNSARILQVTGSRITHIWG